MRENLILNNMKRVVALLLFTVCCYVLTNAQTTLILQPDATAGKDALLHGLASEVNNNYGSIPDFYAAAWTFGGVPGVIRSIVEFDLTSVPANAIITSAKLSLFARDNTSGIGQHSTLSGPNDCWLERITSAWDESTVTWNTQPSTTTQNRVTLPASTSPTENYTDIDVTALVQDMTDKPTESFGFMLKLSDENYYRKLVFCSSDNTNPDLRPKLELAYSIASGVNEPKGADLNVTFYPNPAGDLITVKVNAVFIGTPYSINDLLERPLLTGKLTLERSEINIKELPRGIYILRVGERNQKSYKLIKK